MPGATVPKSIRIVVKQAWNVHRRIHPEAWEIQELAPRHDGAYRPAPLNDGVFAKGLSIRRGSDIVQINPYPFGSRRSVGLVVDLLTPSDGILLQLNVRPRSFRNPRGTCHAFLSEHGGEVPLEKVPEPLLQRAAAVLQPYLKA